jgi:hypothetical protein
LAQTSSINGTILDSAGSKLGFVTVTATNTASHVDTLATSTDKGAYKFEGLPAGSYKLNAAVQGFQMPDLPAIDLREAESRKLDITFSMTASERIFRKTRPVFQFFETTWVGNAIRTHQYPFAIIEVFHLFGLTLLLGGMFLMSLRLFGFIMRDMPVPQVARQLGWISLLGIIVMVVTGVSLFASEAIKCYNSSMYWYKMAFFFPAIIFHFTVYRKVTRSPNSQPFIRGLTGCLSIFLWFGVAVRGHLAPSS